MKNKSNRKSENTMTLDADDDAAAGYSPVESKPAEVSADLDDIGQAIDGLTAGLDLAALDAEPETRKPRKTQAIVVMADSVVACDYQVYYVAPKAQWRAIAETAKEYGDITGDYDLIGATSQHADTPWKSVEHKSCDLTGTLRLTLRVYIAVSSALSVNRADKPDIASYIGGAVQPQGIKGKIKESIRTRLNEVLRAKGLTPNYESNPQPVVKDSRSVSLPVYPRPSLADTRRAYLAAKIAQTV